MIHYFTRLQKQMCDNWNKAALCDYGRDCITFGQLATQMAKFHLLFDELGIKKGEKIAISAKNQARWGVVFLAVNTYGAVIVPILDTFHPDGITRLVNHSESVLLFTDAELWKKLSSEGMPHVKAVINVSDYTPLSCEPENQILFDRLDRSFEAKYPAGFSSKDLNYPTDNDKDLAVINYTSGSTGEPKGVMLRYECFSANVEYGQKRIPSYPEDNILSISACLIEYSIPSFSPSLKIILPSSPSPSGSGLK